MPHAVPTSTAGVRAGRPSVGGGARTNGRRSSRLPAGDGTVVGGPLASGATQLFAELDFRVRVLSHRPLYLVSHRLLGWASYG